MSSNLYRPAIVSPDGARIVFVFAPNDQAGAEYSLAVLNAPKESPTPTHGADEADRLALAI